jgi:small subunit ribosomal protein S18
MVSSTERRTRRRSKAAAGRGPQKPCALCAGKVAWVDYKNVTMLRGHMNDRGKIRARRATGNCAQHQHEIAMAVKTARQLGLLPYAPRTVTDAATGPQSPGRVAMNDVTGGVR